METTVTVTGPLFDGTADQVLTAAIEAGSVELAQAGVDAVHSRLRSVLRKPTGRYESRVVADLSTPTNPRITDGGIVYGPWLEGTSGRNDRSRFKGYRTFRIVAQDLEGKAAAIAGPVIVDRAVKGLS